ncbi:MAG: hypothetical protein HY829_05480 [Actinobacteria bacterium]|nr:hypothetical protein [Actinomycetota bacterium]
MGAILYLAVPNLLRGVDTKMIGIILFIAAVIWLVLGLVLTRPRTRVVTDRTAVEGTPTRTVPGTAAPQSQVVEREVRQDDV